MSIKEFFGKAAAGIYVSGLSVIALVVALIGYIMYGTEKNNLEAVIIVFTVIAVVAGLMEMILTLAKADRSTLPLLHFRPCLLHSWTGFYR